MDHAPEDRWLWRIVTEPQASRFSVSRMLSGSFSKRSQVTPTYNSPPMSRSLRSPKLDVGSSEKAPCQKRTSKLRSWSVGSTLSLQSSSKSTTSSMSGQQFGCSPSSSCSRKTQQTEARTSWLPFPACGRSRSGAAHSPSASPWSCGNALNCSSSCDEVGPLHLRSTMCADFWVEPPCDGTEDHADAPCGAALAESGIAAAAAAAAAATMSYQVGGACDDWHLTIDTPRSCCISPLRPVMDTPQRLHPASAGCEQGCDSVPESTTAPLSPLRPPLTPLRTPLRSRLEITRTPLQSPCTRSPVAVMDRFKGKGKGHVPLPLKGKGKHKGSQPMADECLPMSPMPPWNGPRPDGAWKAERVVNWQPIRSKLHWSESVWQKVHEQMQDDFDLIDEKDLRCAFMKLREVAPTMTQLRLAAKPNRSPGKSNRRLNSHSALTADLLYAKLLREGICSPEHLRWAVGGLATSLPDLTPQQEPKEVSEDVVQTVLDLLDAVAPSEGALLQRSPLARASHSSGVAPTAHPPAEVFLRALLAQSGPISRLRPRVALVLGLFQFPAEAETLQKHLGALLLAVRGVLDSGALPFLLHGVLCLGNYVNSASKSLGGAVGVTLDSLARLAHTRCLPPFAHVVSPAKLSSSSRSQAPENALVFLVRRLEAKRPGFSDLLAGDLDACLRAKDQDLKALADSMRSLESRIVAAEAQLRRAEASQKNPCEECGLVEPIALQPPRLRAFLNLAKPQVDELAACMTAVEASARELRAYFAEPAERGLIEMLRCLAALRSSLPCPTPTRGVVDVSQGRRSKTGSRAALVIHSPQRGVLTLSSTLVASTSGQNRGARGFTAPQRTTSTQRSPSATRTLGKPGCSFGVHTPQRQSIPQTTVPAVGTPTQVLHSFVCNSPHHPMTAVAANLAMTSAEATSNPPAALHSALEQSQARTPASVEGLLHSALIQPTRLFSPAVLTSP